MVPLPESLSFAEGAAISCGTGTACFTRRYSLDEGEEAYRLFNRQTTGRARESMKRGMRMPAGSSGDGIGEWAIFSRRNE